MLLTSHRASAPDDKQLFSQCCLFWSLHKSLSSPQRDIGGLLVQLETRPFVALFSVKVAPQRSAYAAAEYVGAGKAEKDGEVSPGESVRRGFDCARSSQHHHYYYSHR